MGDYRSLQVWQVSHRLTLAVYQATSAFPARETYGLTSQVRRAASAIPANIAEGCGRNSDRELARYCRISLGSASELEYHLLLARDLGMLETGTHTQLSSEVARVKSMLARLVRSLSTDSG